MDDDSDKPPWKDLRKRAFWIAVILTIASIVGLVVLFQFQPSADPDIQRTEKGKLDPGTFGALQTLLTTALGIGAISLIFDLLLREQYGKALRRFLSLKAALVRSGLTDVAQSTAVPWKDIVDPASEITVIARDPSQWLLPHLPHMMRAAQRRSTTITIALPDPGGPRIGEIAGSVGLTDQTLSGNIQVAIDTIENQWNANKPHLHRGSTIKVVEYEDLPLHELLVADETIVCLVSRALNHDVGAYQLAVTFAQARDRYPSSFLLGATEDLDQLNPRWAGDAR